MVDNTLRITFDFEPRHAAEAFQLFGERGTPAAIALITKGASLKNELHEAEAENETVSEEPKKAEVKELGQSGPWGKFASTLYGSGFFYGPAVWAALGTDEQYRKWIQRQPSAYSGDFSEWIHGEGRCIAAHVRRAGEAGTGYKPPYSCIPLTDKEHQLQHQQGENALDGLDWDKLKNEYLIKWAVGRLYEIFGIDSLTKMHPNDFVDWCQQNDLTPYVPNMYRKFKGAA